jgi:hypothetical protein
MFTYPFSMSEEEIEYSKNLKDGRDYFIWKKPGLNLQAELLSIDKPIIEIGGPTEDGFYFLDGLELKTKPVITNLYKSIPSYEKSKKETALRYIEQEVDVMNMPYDDASVGVFLMKGMYISSGWSVDLDWYEADTIENEDRMNEELDKANLEVEQVAIGTLKPQNAKFSVRVKAYLEITKKLSGGGLLFTDAQLSELIVLQNLGFEILVYRQEQIRNYKEITSWTGISYDVVMKKSKRSS